ncbi:unannotated protein [freshwater metagenome]|uniref:Unannotated protein n=1 Tax=freshwater metagenome TaxID=449393 RepID=A0A6J7HL28_9ZZZZ|nr:hypothetical protein [Actinomycetota bacterium]
MRIAVYAIARDESANVQQWADSCKEADYRILVDTGSIDDTVEKAIAAGITTVKHIFDPWRFDDARNFALALVPDDVDLCISLDLDEVLVDGWRQALEASYNPQATRYRYLYTWSWRDDGTPGLQYGGDKIHTRNDYVWRYPVHEVLICQTDEVQAWSELQIHHRRDQTKSREQYLTLLELAVSEDLDNDRNSHYLGREYMYEQRYEEAAIEFKRHLSLPSAQWRAERAQSMRYLATCEPDRAEFWLQEACNESPDRREPWVDLAFLFMEQQRWQECLTACHTALSLDRKPLEYITEEMAWGSRLDDMAALAASHLHQYERAVEHGELALASEPTNERLQTNLANYRRDLATWGPAQEIVQGSTRWRALPTVRITSVSRPDDLPDGWVLMNPSIASDGKNLRMLVRATNYQLNGSAYTMAEPDQIIRSRIGIVDVSLDAEVTNWQWVNDEQLRADQPRFPVHGVEDARLFMNDRTWQILGAVRDFAESGAIRQVLAQLQDQATSVGSHVPVLVNPWRIPSPLNMDDAAQIYEKNWVARPYSRSAIDVVWSTDPYVQLRVDLLARQVVPIHGRPSWLALHDLRGSTPIFTTPHGSTYVVHQVGPSINESERPHRTYLHQFVTSCGTHVHIGVPWCIEELALEYVAGAAFLDGVMYLSFGRDDRDARIAMCQWGEIKDLLPQTCSEF